MYIVNCMYIIVDYIYMMGNVAVLVKIKLIILFYFIYCIYICVYVYIHILEAVSENYAGIYKPKVQSYLLFKKYYNLLFKLLYHC